MLYSHVPYHNDTIIKDARRKTSLTKYLPLTLLQGFEKGYTRFVCERELETEQKLQYFDPYSYDRQHCLSRLASSTQLLLSSNLTQTSACFRCVTSPAPSHRISSQTIMTSEWHLHSPARARVNTCLNVAPN